MANDSSTVEAALEDLYGGVEPGEFIERRDAIAKRLKAAGETDAAADIRGRRKPTVTAWVLNQLARRHPDEVAELVDVGRELSREHRRALRGDAGPSLRESIARQRKVIGDMTQTATHLMTELGVDPGAHLDAVASALRAALVDSVVGVQLEEGRFEKAPEPAAGFVGTVGEATAPAAPLPVRDAGKRAKGPAVSRLPKEKKALAKKRTEERAALAKERAQRQAEARAHAKAIERARNALRAAEADAKHRRGVAEKAREAARRAAEQADTLAAEAKAAVARAADARRALERVA